MNAPVAEPSSEWFWVVTLQWPSPRGGFVVNTGHGTVAVPVSATRRDAYEGVMAQARRQARVPVDVGANVLFCSIEPMALADRGQK